MPKGAWPEGAGPKGAGLRGAPRRWREVVAGGGGGGGAGPMWRTLGLASAFFPGLFALCTRALRWAAPAWSSRDRVLLSGR